MKNIELISKTLTILSGASVSEALQVTSEDLVNFISPAAWTTAALSIEVSADGADWIGTVKDYTDTQTNYFSSLSATTAYSVDFQANLGFAFLRFRSGTSASPVNQGADRVFKVYLRNMDEAA